MTRFLAMKLLNMAILGRAEQHYTADPFQPEPKFPGASLDSDALVHRHVEFPDLFDNQTIFNSVYLVMDRRNKVGYQVGEVNLKLSTLLECASECYRTDDCNFFSAMVKSFWVENDDELDMADPINCLLFSSMYYDPMDEDRRRWTSGQMPPKNGAWALSLEIENWINDYPVERVDLINNKPKFVYLPNFASAWSWGVHKQLVQGECSLIRTLFTDKDIGECFDECLMRPNECNAIIHGFNEEKQEFDCSLLYMHTYDEGPRFEDYNRAAENSKHDRKCWQEDDSDEVKHYNTWRVVPRSEDFPLYGSTDSMSGYYAPMSGYFSPMEELRPDIVPDEWADRRLYVISANKRLLHGDSTLSQDATTFESCGKLCVEKWSKNENCPCMKVCRAFSFNNRAKLCELSHYSSVDSEDHSGDWISVQMKGGPSTTTTTTTTTKEMRNFGKNCLEDGIIWNGQCSGDYQTGWNDIPSNADVDAANQLLGCRQEAWTDVEPLCLRHGSVCPKECAGYDELNYDAGEFINFSYEDWMELGRKDGMMYPEEL